MSRRKTYIELEEIPTLKQAYEERKFSPRNLKRATTLTRKYDHNEEFNKKISLIQADITKLKIDAIVNAANETLLGGGGVDGAIHRAAGPELRHECWDLNGCETGDAKITKGYDLPSKYVIHTVGPVGEKPHLLRSAYERSMQVMYENDLKSIAFSNISTGVYGYPRPKAGHLALDTMRKWLEQNSDYFDKLDRIIFCVFEDENKDVYETLFPLYFPPPVDIDEYVKEEEKLRPKTNEEKKNNEAEKDKDQVKTLTSLTAEQINANKEIIGTDNNNGIKEKDEKKNHETLTTGQVNDKGLSTDKDKENKEKVEDKDEKKVEDKEDKEDKDKENEEKAEDKDKDKANKEKAEDKDEESKEKVEDKDEESKEKVEDKDKENKDDDKENKEKVEDNDKGIKEKVEDKDKENKEKGEDNDKENKDKVEDNEKTQDTDMSAVSTEQDKRASVESTEQNKPETGASAEQDKQSTDVSTESNKQDKQDTEMPNASAEQDKQGIETPNASIEPNIPDETNQRDEDTIMSEADTADIEQVKDQKQNEQNSKKRSHEDVETEQDDAKGSQNNTTNVTEDTDVSMEDATDEPPTDVSKMEEDSTMKNEQNQKTSQTDGNISMNKDDNVTKAPENNSKI